MYDSSVEDVCGGNADLAAQGCPITQATRLGCYICIWRSIPLQWLLSLDLMKNKVNLKPRRSFEDKAYCVLLAFVFFKLKSLQTENFAICFVVCFVIRGLAKNKEGKDLEDVLITCTAEVRKMRVIMKMRSYKYKDYTMTKERLFLREKVLLMQLR